MPQAGRLLLTPFARDGMGTDEDPSIAEPAERDRRFGQWDHVRIYDRDDFMARMRSVGFATELYEPYADDAEMAEALHLNREEALPVGRRTQA